VPELEALLDHAADPESPSELAVHLPEAGAAGPGVACGWGDGAGTFRPARGAGCASEDQADTGAARRGGGHDPGKLELVRGFLGDLGRRSGRQRPQFLELNREQALVGWGSSPRISFWSINPQVHAVDVVGDGDDRSAGATVRTARAFAGDRPWRCRR
jgi:hypothetical protein